MLDWVVELKKLTTAVMLCAAIEAPIRPYWWPEPFVPIMRLLLGASCLVGGISMLERVEGRNGTCGGGVLLFLGIMFLFLGPW